MILACLFGIVIAMRLRLPVSPRIAFRVLPHRAGMLSLLALVGSVGIAIPGAAIAAQIEAQSRISAVTVYPDAAIVTRVMTLDLVPGTHDISVPDIPMSADPGSLRVEASGTARMTIGGLDLKASVGPSGADAELAARLKASREARDRLADWIEAGEGRKSMIQRLAQRETAPDSKTFDLESWLKAVEAVGKGLQSVNHELRDLRIKEARLDEEIAALEAALGTPEKQGPKRLALITVEVAAAGKAEFQVSYRVRGASWRPIYDARLDTRGAKPVLDLTRRALLRQTTGETWPDVRVTLSLSK